jgi:hypothetical protein
MDNDFERPQSSAEQDSSLRLLKEISELRLDLRVGQAVPGSNPGTGASLPEVAVTPANVSKLNLSFLSVIPNSYFGAGVGSLAVPSRLLASPYKRTASGGLLIAAGASGGVLDAISIGLSRNPDERNHHALGLVADAGMLAGGVMVMQKVGPKWLGPTVAVTSWAGRIAFDRLNKK